MKNICIVVYTILGIVLIIGFACTFYIVIPHLPGWMKGGDNAITQFQLVPSHSQQFASGMVTQMNAIATDVHRDILVMGGAEGETRETMKLIRKELPSFIQQGHQELAALHDLTTSGKATADEATRAIAQVETMPPHLNDLADQLKTSLIPIPSTLQGINNLSTEITTFVHGPLTFTINNAGQLEDTLNTGVGYVNRHLIPCDNLNHHTRCGWEKIGGTALQLGGLGGTLWRDMK